MPAIHHEPFQVRYYECDAYGQLRNAEYLRWMQEAAFAASAAVGYDFSRYHQIGYLWLVRETEIEYLDPLAYGDRVDIKTWVMDIRRFRSRRGYEFTHARTGQQAARASTDWVYLDSDTLRPTAIPEEMQLAFFPEGVPKAGAPRDRFPTPPPPPPNVFTLQRRVAWRDIDMMWHVNNAMYLAYIEEATAQAFDACNWPTQRMMEAGFRMVPRQQRIEYRQPAMLGDQLAIAVWFSDVGRSTAASHYTLRRVGDGELLVRARAVWEWVDPESGRPVGVPEGFLTGFAGLVVDGP